MVNGAAGGLNKVWEGSWGIPHHVPDLDKASLDKVYESWALSVTIAIPPYPICISKSEIMQSEPGRSMKKTSPLRLHGYFRIKRITGDAEEINNYSRPEFWL